MNISVDAVSASDDTYRRFYALAISRCKVDIDVQHHRYDNFKHDQISLWIPIGVAVIVCTLNLKPIHVGCVCADT